MKLTSGDCKDAISAFMSNQVTKIPDEINPDNWKRISKTGNALNGYTRIFTNKITGKIIKITSDETDITGIFIEAVGSTIAKQTTQQPASNGGLLSLCRSIANSIGCAQDDYGRIVWKLPFDRLPQLPDPDGNGTEDVDFENMELISIDDNTIRLVAGGDWQEPVEFSATMVNGILTYNNDATEGSPTGD